MLRHQGRSPRPVHARVTDMRIYRKLLRQLIQVPLFNSMRIGIEQAASARVLLQQLEQMHFNPVLNNQAFNERLLALFNSMQAWHRARLIDTFRRALGIDITGYLAGPQVAPLMMTAVETNVALISTIPQHAHAGLAHRLQQYLLTEPFNQQALRKLLREQYSVTGSRLTLISRDQVTKLIGQLTGIRQQEAGVRSYVWLTSRDGRVRPTHAANEGRRFFWASPPPETGHPGTDIQCRCNAIAYIPGISGYAR